MSISVYDGDFIDYDLNGMFAVRIDEGLLPQIQKQFSYWRSQGTLEKIDLRIEKGTLSPCSMIRATSEYSFFEGGFVRQGGNGNTEFRPGFIIIDGNTDEGRVEAHFIRQWVNQVLLRKGWCLAHASALVYKRKTILFPAMRESGKTSLMLEFLGRGANFLGDDRVMVGENGRLALYPRWIHMMEHNWTMFPELFERAFPDEVERMKNKNQLRRYRIGLKMREGNLATRYLKSHYTSRYHFDSIVPPEKLFPASKVILNAEVDYSFFLEMSTQTPTIIDSNASRLARLSVSSYGIEGFGLFKNLSLAAGIDHLDRDFMIKVMESFFSKSKCFEVRVKAMMTRDDVAKIADEIIEHIF